MKGFLGPYSMTREGSGTSWVPDTTPHEGVHGKVGDWSTMWHGYFNLIYDHQGGPRGGDKTFVNGMVMGMAQRPLGDGTLGVRAMLSPDPFMGKSGYPLLLASGETADGRTHLIDRQHPHDLFMELAGDLQPQPQSPHRACSSTPAFRASRRSGRRPSCTAPAAWTIPEAPITHHWLDSTHITFGVVTAGLILDKWKMEASAFRGREPDQHRYDIEAPKLDSFSARLSWNPIRELSMQVSVGTAQFARAIGAGRQRGSRHRFGDLHTAVRQGQSVEHHRSHGAEKFCRPGANARRLYAGKRADLQENLHAVHPCRASGRNRIARGCRSAGRPDPDGQQAVGRRHLRLLSHRPRQVRHWWIGQQVCVAECSSSRSMAAIQPAEWCSCA